jgi:hypothetical protein
MLIKRLVCFLIVAMVLMSCEEEKKVYSEDVALRKVDSMVQLYQKVLQAEYQEDLKRRLSIEVKPKVDSLLQSAR